MADNSIWMHEDEQVALDLDDVYSAVWGTYKGKRSLFVRFKSQNHDNPYVLTSRRGEDFMEALIARRGLRWPALDDESDGDVEIQIDP